MTKPIEDEDFFKIISEDMERTVEIEEAISDKKEEGDVNVIIANKVFTQDVNNQFVMLFLEAFDEIIIEYKLTMLEMRIMLNLLKRSAYGNLLSFKQSSVAKDLKTSAPNVSRTIKKMIKSSVLIKTDDGEMYINPHIVAKGNLKKMRDAANYDELTEKSKFKNF